MSRFVEVITDSIDPAFVDADKITSLAFRPDDGRAPYWLAKTIDNRTFRLSEEIARILLLNAIRADLEYDEAA